MRGQHPLIESHTVIDTASLLLWAVFPGCRLVVKRWAVVCLDPKPAF